MNHRERLEASISGKAVDRPPVALWRHFPVDDMQPETLAAAHVWWQREFDFDLLKVTPASSYFLYDWGLKDKWEGAVEGTRTYIKRVVETLTDWGKLSLHDPKQGSLKDVTEALKRITQELGPEEPVIMTIFNPLGNARKMAGNALLLRDLQENPKVVKPALELLTEDTINFLAALEDTGIAGIFYAVQHASKDVMSTEIYEEFGRPYDMEILAAAEKFWFNLLHLHGDNVRFDQFTDYPVQAVNWHDRETELDLASGKTKFAGAVCGGLRQMETMYLGTAEDVRAEARDAIEATGGERFILGTGCVTMTPSPYGNVRAARDVVDGG
jgi:uroporphyrinogen decarboxylase